MSRFPTTSLIVAYMMAGCNSQGVAADDEELPTGVV